MEDTATAPPPVRPRAPGSPAGDSHRPRIVALDVLRGFALCGILLVNIGPVTHFGTRRRRRRPRCRPERVAAADVQQRCLPIFSLLFGIGFSLFLASAARRRARGRVPLLRRLPFLLALGLAHQLLHPGEALASYAVVGLIVLLPSSWLPRWLVALGAAVAIPLALLVAGGGLLLIPGAFLLASGLSIASALAGVLLAGAYVTGILALLQTGVAPALRVLFAPRGRMALTNCVSATPVIVLAGYLLDLPDSRSWAAVFAVCAAILVVQWACSTLWLRSFRYGPLEWVWRWVTWWRRPALLMRSS